MTERRTVKEFDGRNTISSLIGGEIARQIGWRSGGRGQRSVADSNRFIDHLPPGEGIFFFFFSRVTPRDEHQKLWLFHKMWEIDKRYVGGKKMPLSLSFSIQCYALSQHMVKNFRYS